MKPLSLAIVLTYSLLASTVVRAESSTEATTADSADDVKADVKAAAGIENRLPTGEANSFKTGETVYVWSQITGANGKVIEHVWKRDGQEIRRARLPVGAKRWKTNSRLQKAAKGAYVVEVVLGDQQIGEVAFTVE